MSNSMLVRASRDGDQFHYLWAARRALLLLNPQSGLVAVTIEGPSTAEFKACEPLETGEELIDIGEYYGSTTIENATRIRYMQLKHSTLRVNEVWQPSGLEDTVKGFAERYTALRKKLPLEVLHEKLEFCFVTNRPISLDFIEAVQDAAARRAPRHFADLKKLKKFTSLDDAELAQFCGMLRFEGRQDDYWTQRNILLQDISGYLPELDVDAPIRLKELVTRKALSESFTNPTITKMDVLRALQTDEIGLFPAPCLIEKLEEVVPRKQEAALVEAIVGARERPIIVQADAGVGKSVFSTRIGIRLPIGSVCILYDCFGNGQYRSATGYRHRHRTALVQIANELSSLGLCHPLIPTNADTSTYMRAFVHRVKQSISVLRARNAAAVLCVIVDAADNAQMAAEEINEPRSFVRDLLREQLPEEVRIIALCRPHRVELLNPPPNSLLLELKAFSHEETATHLRHRFADATEYDVDEFHRLSSNNPRVQALALSGKAPLTEILRLLGPNPTTVENTIAVMLEGAIAKLRDAAGHGGATQVDLICAGLAALRPLIPISVLASMSGVDQAAIKSFALDLGRPLIVNGDTIQFFDEPAETWFCKHFRPNETSIIEFVTRLKKLTATSPYVASVLPQLMLQAGQFSELVELALTSCGLPETSPVERRDIELQRLQFAFKASLRLRRYADAAKLALKAGGESAGDDRQRLLLQNNIDLASLFLDSNSVQELVSRRTFGSGWVGAHHVYEAALLAGHGELIGEARSRLRMAEEWLRNWSKLTSKERSDEPVSDEDRAVMAMAHFSIHGAKAAAKSLRVWRPRKLSYSAGRIMARRFLDHGRYFDLEQLAIAADNDLGLILAIAVETRIIHRLLPKEAAERGLKLLADRRVKIDDLELPGELALTAVTAMVETSYLHGLCDALSGKALLERYLPEMPPYGLTSRYTGLRSHYMRAYALRAALAGKPLQLIDFATAELRMEIEGEKPYSESSELRQFKESIGALLPWYKLWGAAFLGQLPKEQLARAIADAKSDSAKAGSTYREELFTFDEIVEVWIDVLLDVGGVDNVAIREIIDSSKSLKRQLFEPTLIRLARICAQTSDFEELAFEFAQMVFGLLQDERSDAQSKAEGYVEIARSILAISRSESKAYFDQALVVASKIGDENLERWDALIDLAERAARSDRPTAEVAYKFARCAEVTRSYVDRDKHFPWNATVNALTYLCPSSSLAIISRWRDRRFGNDEHILALAIEALVSRGSVNPVDALAMIGFRADWDEDKLLEFALPLCSGKDAKFSAFNLIYRYMTLRAQSTEKWRRLEAMTVSYGIQLPGLNARSVGRDIDNSNVEETNATYYSHATEKSEVRNWEEVFTGANLTTPAGISVAYQRFRAGDPPLFSDAFFREAIKRIPVSRAAEFVTCFDYIPEFDLFSLRTFLEVFPSEWRRSLGIQKSLASMLKRFCRRFCMTIKRSRYYETMSIERACELSGLEESQLLDVIFAGIAETSELAGPDRFFSLVGLLSSKLTNDEGLEVLTYGLDLFNCVLEESDGDGPWTAKLKPPPIVEDALAGYIWAGLASPVAATRWEASHVVLALCALGRTRILDGLFNHVSANTTKPFNDVRFVFYNLHAQQWFLIATARAALEFGTALVPYINHFLSYLGANQLHVLIRLFAARTVLALADQGLIELTVEVQEQLIEINTSPFDPTKLKSSEGYGIERKMVNADDGLQEKDKYFFGIDFGPYWLKPLGRCFGLTQSKIERETLNAIRGDLCYNGCFSWSEDARSQQRLYEYESTQYRHGGSSPRIDNLQFYLSYHAMLITAGRLLASTPLVEWGDAWENNSFSDWIKRYDITREDRRWLADRRDPQPTGFSERLPECDRYEWLSSISADDFEQALYVESGCLTVWGGWSKLDSSRVESISVNTALVSSERSASLLRALQTAENHHDYRIPDANDDLQIDDGPYQLKGWIVDRPNEQGIDGRDPWAGEVRFPVPEPATFVTEMMNLSTDSDRRLWMDHFSPAPALRSETWGDYQESNSSELPRGSRLQVSVPFLVKFLTAIGMDLVVKVEIQRRFLYQLYDRRDVDDLQNISPSARIFIVKGDGTICTL